MEGDTGVGGVWEAGLEGVGSWIPKVAGSGRNRGKLCKHCTIFYN